MRIYERRLESPVNIREPSAQMARFIMNQYGRPDGEMGTSICYLSRRHAMPYKECKRILTNIGTEELARLEIVAAIIHQLTRGLTANRPVEQGFRPYHIDHTTSIWPQTAGGVSFNARKSQSKRDVTTGLHEDMAIEQEARSIYDNILRVVKDYDVCGPAKFLREREVVHYRKFGESLCITQKELDSRNFYAFNPALDVPAPSCQDQIGQMQGHVQGYMWKTPWSI